ncbi:ATP-dependent helicase [Xanthomonas vesicatoria]|uniref:DNA 3'-5' helicase n=1 Tax=Xanthomonas vesicatoria TaxID=56460 RepID=A0ABS8L442_9XANT|nr:ATP-dependent helicase [Xanthomonas vesicatoria]APO93300.1 hypothetical protein BI313_00605 [Xanthomonas vesicatoria]MCC8620502.1 ATP-dependent helicase [Xanthomonas vesicatoria]MCC8630126.1 ATP-dependent helicase [Xanthomonas vesicatoria]MDG4491482.1 ATP-dependent helicase [Xanthomonas vesicatoria]
MSRRFTDEQIAVANHVTGHALVSAVAGAGKTTTLVERCRRLIATGIPEGQILCLQYNKEAQLDFSSRLTRRMGSSDIPHVKTYHAFCLAMWKQLEQQGHVGRTVQPKDSGSAEDAMMRQALKDQAGKGVYVSQEQFEMLNSLKTLTKSCFDTPGTVYDRTDMPYETRTLIVGAYIRFENERLRRRLRFFDDQIYDTAVTLRGNPELWSLFRGRYQQIQVDEFQDISEVQMSILEGITGPDTTVVVVGDADQAIYSWRGSKVSYIVHEFAARFTPCTRFAMSRTFRFGDELALFANHIVVNNKERDDKISIAEEGNPNTLVELTYPVKGRNAFIINLLQERMANGSLSDAAMLCRNYSHSVPLQMEMLMSGIPFFVYGREATLYNPEIGCLVGAMAMAADHWPFPTRSIPRFIQAMMVAPTVFVSNAVTQMLTVHAMEVFEDQGSQAVGKGMLQAVNQIASIVTQHEMERLKTGLPMLKDRASFMEMLCAGGMRSLRPGQVIDTYIQYTNLIDSLLKHSRTREDGEEKVRNVQAMRAAAEGFETLTAFLDELGPMAAHEKDKPPKHPHVRIQSVHSSKGAEFPLVILPSWNAGVVPANSPLDAEEERRLAYVAVTRAKHHLVIQHAEDPMLTGWIEQYDDFPPANDGIRRASPYLFEGELGISMRVAEAVRDGVQDCITLRNPRVAQRYIEAKGMAGLIRIETLPHLAALSAGRPLTDISSLAPGAQIWSRSRGTCEVIGRVGTSPAFHIRLADGSTAYEVLTEGGDWMVL